VRLEAGEMKNAEGREVYLDEELKKVFIEQAARRLKAGKLSPYVFPNHDRTDRIKDIRGTWGAACMAAGFFRLEQDGEKTVKVPTRLFHDFRRTAVRNMVRAGIPERVAMMISGHKTRSVFDRYNIVSDADPRIAAAKQEAYLETQMGTISGTILEFEKKRESV
jgi:integrase